MTRDGTTEALDDISEDLRRRVLGEHGDWYGFRMILIGNYYSGQIWTLLQKEFGLLRDEFAILANLHDYGPMTANVIRAMTGRPKNSISRGTIKLIQNGYVAAAEDSIDRRHTILTITPAGEALFQKVIPLFRAREKEMFGCLTPAEIGSLDTILAKVLENWHGRSPEQKRIASITARVSRRKAKNERSSGPETSN